jgi:Lipopolysaccharide-assembly
MARLFHHRLWFACLLAGTAGVLPSCTSDGHVNLLGYTSRPNYDLTIRTVFVPTFKNFTFRRGMEFDLTRAVIREIEAKTPFKVVSCETGADTILTGSIVSFNKNLTNIDPLNEVRQAETLLTVQVAWVDNRPATRGDVLSFPKPPGAPPGVANPIPPGVPLPPPPPTAVQSLASYIPELGESLTTGEQKNVNRLAVQIVSLMEKPW